jgi:hypothetical protein
VACIVSAFNHFQNTKTYQGPKSFFRFLNSFFFIFFTKAWKYLQNGIYRYPGFTGAFVEC